MGALYLPEYLFYKEGFYRNMAVYVEGDTIKEIGQESLLSVKYAGADREEWNHLIMIPGTVNVHNHSFQSLLRGACCDRPFLEWRDQALYKYSPRFRKEDIYNGALFAFGEMMKYGVTCVSDFFYLHNYGLESDEMIIQAAKDIGIRLVLARTMYDWKGAPEGYVESLEEAVSKTRTLANKYNQKDQMVTVIPAPHSMHAASLEMIKAGHSLAKELGTCYHIHVAEEMFEVDQVKNEFNGRTPIEVLDEAGVVDASMVIVHGVWLKESEIRTLGRKGAKLAYCPSSNMFLADGITDIPAMREAGVLIGLGSDGACSNNRISIFEEMRMVALLQKVSTCNSMCLNYKEAFLMGTENGGKLLQLPIGKLEEGYKADFVGIQCRDISMQPITEQGEQILPNLVYSMQPNAVAKVVINGKLTVDQHNILTISEQEIINGVQVTMKSISD